MFSKHSNSVALNTFSHHVAHIADPGDGNHGEFPCPANSRIRITNIQYILTTLAVDNFPQVFIIHALGTYLRMSYSAFAPGFLTTTEVNISTGITEHIYRVAYDFLQMPLPHNLFISPGESLMLTTNAMAGTVGLTDIYISYDQWIIA